MYLTNRLKYFFLILVIISVFGACNSNESSKKIKQLSIIENNKITHSEYLKESELLSYIYNANVINFKPSIQKPFDTLKFNKLIAYDYEGSEEPNPSVLDEKNKFNNVILKQKYLNNEQAKFLIETLTKTSTYGESTAGCFNPDLGFLFFNNNKKVYSIDVCLDCNYLIAESSIPAMEMKKMNKGTENEYAAIGFSKIGKSKIKKLCSQLNFFYGRKEK